MAKESKKAKGTYVRPETEVRNSIGIKRSYERPETEEVKAGKTERGYTTAQAKAILSREESIRKNKNESVHFFDDYGKEIFSKKGRGTSVNLTREAAAGLIPQNAIITHNHPRALGKTGIASIGNSFSPEDIILAVRHNAKEIRAKTPTYTFSLKRPKGGWGVSAENLTMALRAGNRSLRNEASRYVFDGKDIPDLQRRDQRQMATHYHRLVKQMAQRYGWNYTKKKG